MPKVLLHFFGLLPVYYLFLESGVKEWGGKEGDQGAPTGLLSVKGTGVV